AFTMGKGTAVWIKRLNSSVSTNMAIVRNNICVLTDKGTVVALRSQ
ncbi:MAG: hypothetical protein HY880_03135, partial [Deltaproteobacteria bacterium]|nr:hypothetical protein [Deltaproteobacteria bacterium]